MTDRVALALAREIENSSRNLSNAILAGFPSRNVFRALFIRGRILSICRRNSANLEIARIRVYRQCDYQRW